jgi:ATP-dependent Clp protease ATP-binding subunit ClpA
LTKDCEDGKLDPVIGRDDEIRLAIQVLCRRTKNNPILLGTHTVLCPHTFFFPSRTN